MWEWEERVPVRVVRVRVVRVRVVPVRVVRVQVRVLPRVPLLRCCCSRHF